MDYKSSGLSDKWSAVIIFLWKVKHLHKQLLTKFPEIFRDRNTEGMKKRSCLFDRESILYCHYATPQWLEIQEVAIHYIWRSASFPQFILMKGLFYFMLLFKTAQIQMLGIHETQWKIKGVRSLWTICADMKNSCGKPETMPQRQRQECFWGIVFLPYITLLLQVFPWLLFHFQGQFRVLAVTSKGPRACSLDICKDAFPR